MLCSWCRPFWCCRGSVCVIVREAASLRLRLLEVDGDVRLIADGPHVMARRDVEGVPGRQLAFGPIGQPQPGASRDHVARVAHRAQIRPGDGPDVVSQVKARQERDPVHGDVAETDDVHAGRRGDRNCLVRDVETLYPKLTRLRGHDGLLPCGDGPASQRRRARRRGQFPEGDRSAASGGYFSGAAARKPDIYRAGGAPVSWCPTAHAATCAREVNPSLCRMCLTCSRAVPSGMNSRAPIARCVSPWATRRATSRSRLVKPRWWSRSRPGGPAESPGTAGDSSASSSPMVRSTGRTRPVAHASFSSARSGWLWST